MAGGREQRAAALREWEGAGPGPGGSGATLETTSFMSQRGKILRNSQGGSDINVVVVSGEAASTLGLQETAGDLLVMLDVTSGDKMYQQLTQYGLRSGRSTLAPDTGTEEGFVQQRNE